MKTLTINWRLTNPSIHLFLSILNYKKIAIIFLGFLLPMISFAQKGQQKALRTDNAEIRNLTERVDPSGWLFFSGEKALKEGDLFSKHKTAMGLGENDRMVVVSDVSDKLEMTHVKYQQEHNGIPVEGGEYIVHIKDCIEKIANGELIEGLNISSRPEINESQAFSLATKAVNSTAFAWENEEWEAELQEETGDPKATYRPTAELIIAKPFSAEKSKGSYKLVYRYIVVTTEPYQELQVDIDANSGKTVNMFDTVVECFGHSEKNHVHNHSCNGDHQEDESRDHSKEDASNLYFANGTAPLLYYGTKTIQTKYRGWPFKDYHLKDNSRGNGITTKDNGSNGKIKDKDNVWPSDKAKYTQAHWTCAKAWDYFKNVHGRNGTNGSGKKVKVKANWGNLNATYSGNFWGQTIRIGKNGNNHLSTMDIMAHEYAHGVTKYSAGLVYQGESGALNESFSDIFGTMAEDYANAGGFDWTMGEDASFLIRNMANPPAKGHPDTYGGTNWVDPNSSYDYGGVHINSGVQNKWFYLLSQGGTHNGVTVQAIGKAKAAKIAFRNLTVYLGSGSNYANARVGAINSAKDLYGQCSFEEIQTTNAWAAVGVGNQFVGNCVKITGGHFICVYGFNMLPRTFTATGLPGSTFTWSNIPSNWNYTIYGTGNKYLKLNSVSIPASNLPVTVNLTVTSSQGGSDNHYVTLEDCRFDPCDMRMK